ncbi:MAG: flagellar motor switch protein FliG [Spirochaetaceae bacterium]|nr:flagellar motor switch protein FliG [Spirochaetaceae bacterium]
MEIKRKLDAYKHAVSGAADGVRDDVQYPVKQAKPEAAGEAVSAGSWREKAKAFAKVPYRSLLDEQAKNAETNAGNESRARKVAKFLILIGQEQAAKVLANLDEAQVESISREIAGIKGITKEEASDVFAEFQGLLSSSLAYGSGSGGVEEARRLLYAAFGPDKGETFLRRSVPDARETAFSFLEEFSGEQIAMLLRDELPAAGAMILSRIPPKLAAETLACADLEWRLDTARRIGRLGKISPEAIEKTAEALREKARKIGGSSTSDLDGMGALAAILKHSTVSFGDKILRDLSEEDPELGDMLKDRLYTLDDVIKADDKPIQKKLQDMSSQEIACLVKGQNEGFVEKILSNLSSRRRSEIRDELSFMGPLSKKDSDAAIKAFMDWFRDERENGQIIMIGDELVN